MMMEDRFGWTIRLKMILLKAGALPSSSALAHPPVASAMRFICSFKCRSPARSAAAL
jgi:hypothetical protein